MSATTASPPRVRPGQTVENPVTGERFTFTDTAASSDGELLAFDFALRPGGAVPMAHVHPVQTERFAVTEGKMRFRVGRRTVIAVPGDVVEVAPGVAHSFANAGEGEARLHVEVRPALAMEEMFADVVALARAGRMTARGMPRSLIDLAVLARAYDREAHAPLIGRRLQRALLAPPAAIARLRAGGSTPLTTAETAWSREAPSGYEGPMLLILAIILLIIAIAGGVIIHPIIFALAIVALALFFSGRR